MQRQQTNLMGSITAALLLAFLAPASAQAETASDTPAASETAPAQDKRVTALSLIKTPKFADKLEHFDWVNPNAPKGGHIRRWELGSFDSLNPYTVKGSTASGMSLIYDSLMADSPDEPSTSYGLVAEWVSHPDDFSSATFGLRKDARFHDGKPIRPEDVIFTMNALKKSHPAYAYYYKNVTKVEKTADHQVTFTFDTKNNRELPLIVGQLPVLPEHYWTATGANGKPRDLSKTTLEIPLGSGPYKISEVVAGRTITYSRVDDYWAKDLPVVKGQWNFDKISYRYYRDRTPAFEDFKGGSIHFWAESSAKSWATDYDVKPVKDGRIKKELLKNGRVAGMQAFVFNLRRDMFKNRKVREALNLIYNFEQANKTLFYEQYTRLSSFFDNSTLRATGKPKDKELEILDSVKDQIPAEVFGEVWQPPKSNSSTAHRKNLRRAVSLLKEAGWTRQKNGLVSPDGKPFEIEILLVSSLFERVVLPFIADLKKVGINARARVVDTAQYKRRLDTFDFDMVVGSFGQSHSPGNEQREFWGSKAADNQGSRNIAGIKNPAIDKLIERLVFATGRDDLIAATRALDRTLLWNYYVIPQWYLASDRVAFWNYIKHPSKLPSQNISVLRTWWIDKAAADALTAAGAK